jgi:hypothetical protein
MTSVSELVGRMRDFAPKMRRWMPDAWSDEVAEAADLIEAQAAALQAVHGDPAFDELDPAVFRQVEAALANTPTQQENKNA